MQNPKMNHPLSNTGKTFIQQVTGVFLFLGRAVDSILLMPLNVVASEQTSPTEETMQKCRQFLDYISSQEEAVLTFQASDMILEIHSDASFLSEAKARSRVGGNFFISSDEDIQCNNGAVLNISQIIKAVASSLTLRKK